jgi:hypothetical protein
MRLQSTVASLDREGEATHSITISPHPRDETTGGTLILEYAPLSIQTSLIDSAWRIAEAVGPGAVRSQIVELIQAIGWSIQRLPLATREEPMSLRLQSSLAPDGSALLEWISPKFRLGFNLEVERSQSSWFLVTSPELGGLAVSGQLFATGIEPIVNTLVRFISTNS